MEERKPLCPVKNVLGEYEYSIWSPGSQTGKCLLKTDSHWVEIKTIIMYVYFKLKVELWKTIFEIRMRSKYLILHQYRILSWALEEEHVMQSLPYRTILKACLLILWSST